MSFSYLAAASLRHLCLSGARESYFLLLGSFKALGDVVRVWLSEIRVDTAKVVRKERQGSDG